MAPGAVPAGPAPCLCVLVRGQEITGVSFWDSKEACDAWRASEPEARRRAAMAPYVVEERERFYRGRELAVPSGSRG
jgi:heme-degrading monooxygenase HmoA